MNRKWISALLVLAMFACIIPLTASAAVEPPVSLGSPQNFAVANTYGAQVKFTFGIPDELRDYIEKWKVDDPENHRNFTLYYQMDYRIDNEDWHHTPDWDSPKTVPSGINNYSAIGHQNDYVCITTEDMNTIFRGYEDFKPFSESGWEYLKNHSITFRARFAHSFDYNQTFVLSPWSKEFTLSANLVEDYQKLINHAPSLLSAELKSEADEEPYLYAYLGRLPADIQYLNALSGGNVRTEVWMRRAGEKEFKYIEYEWVSKEILNIEATDYFDAVGLEQSYDAQAYEIKVRYALDLRRYKQSGYSENSDSVDIYSPFSNVISHNMPAWSNASSWATAELKKANDAGLIPDILKGADMTGPITREEFAELAVKLYEQTTGNASVPASPNPFTDTVNPQILKAFNLGITTGTSATTFAPKDLTNREQVATMLSRAIRVMVPGGDFSTAGAPTFTDQKDISSWALDHVLFMAKLGIIKGTDGKFMPRATTDAQKASGYATTTREMAIAMSVRAYDQIKSGSLGAIGNTSSAADGSITGTWTLGNLTGGTFNTVTGKYEGGATGLGQTYRFNADGTYSALVIWSNAMFFTGKYSINNGVLTLTNRVVEESNDDGKTWVNKETLPDASSSFSVETDASGKYLMVIEEGNPNSLKYKYSN